MKTQHTIPVTGRILDGDTAKTQQASEVSYFMDTKKQFRIHGITNESVIVNTNKGSYTLDAHATIANLFTGIASGIKVHFTKKKIVGKLIYWS
ncbi:MAG: hypothetical protein GY860_01950 [Desulfobacteraceae bacterium]|nr:hypothetical protein [Desulfobacteraceae bacterium]